MNIVVQRGPVTPQLTEGQMFLDGLFECYTLEPPMLEPPAKPRAIGAGTYPWKKYMSPKLGIEVVLLTSVPDFVAVEIHPGNDPEDTLACTVVGMIEQENFVGHSREAFAELMAKLPASGTITYRDPAGVPGQQIQQDPQARVS